MKEKLVKRLTTDSAIAAIAGSQVSWFWFQRGESGGRIALTMISPGESWNHDGPDGLMHPRVQIDCRADDPDTANALAEAVKAEMSGAATVDDVLFHPAELAGERTVNEGEQPGGGSLWRIALDFIFYWEGVAETP